MEAANTVIYSYTIRIATEDDLRFLPAVEESAGTLFLSDPALAPLAKDAPMSVHQHREHIRTWRETELGSGHQSGTFVAVRHDETGDSNDQIVGFLVSTPLSIRDQQIQNDGARCFVHIKELSVHVDHQRRGLASRLMAAVKGIVNQRIVDGNQVAGLSLTTFRDVPYNAPFYARCGFQEVSEDDIKVVAGGEGVQI